MDRESDDENLLFRIKNLGLYNPSSIFSSQWIKTCIKDFFYKISINLFVFSYEASESVRSQVISIYLSSLIETLNLLSLLLYPSWETSSLNRYNYLWNVILYSRFDYACAISSFLPTALYLIITLIFLLALGQFLCYTRLLKNQKNPRFCQPVVKFFLSVLSNYFYIPIMVLLITSLKYSLINNTSVAEYNINPTEIIFSQSYIIVTICIIIFYSCAYAFFALSYDNRHYYAKYNLYSRAHSETEKIRIQYITVSIIAYSIFGISHQGAFRLIYGGLSIIVSTIYLKYLPFYSSLVNSIKISSFAYVGIIAMFLEFEYLTNNNNYSFFLTVFVSPCLLGMIFYYSFAISSNISSNYKLSVNIFEFEKRLRKNIINYNGDKDSIISAFSNCYNEKEFGRSFYLVIWLSNFCYYNLNDDRLARINMGTQVTLDYNFEIEFQLYKIRETLNEKMLEYHEDLDYLIFRSKFENIKKDDETLCKLLLILLSKMDLDKNISSLQYTVIPEITKLLTNVSNEYDQFLVMYPKSIAMIDMYSTFLGKITHKPNLAAELQSRKESMIATTRIYHDHISYFDDVNGLIIVSGTFSSFSIITYANRPISKIFCQPLHTIIGSSLNSYIPYPFDRNHEKHMKKYLSCCSNSEIKLPLNLFMQTHIGYLVECDIQVRCTALEGSAFFLILMREKNNKREIAIISEQGMILNHSEYFTSILGINSNSLRNQYIDLYLEGFKFNELEYSKPVTIIKNYIHVNVIKSYRILKRKIINILFLMTDPEEVKNWKRDKFEEEVSYNYHRHLDVEGKDEKTQEKKVFIIEEAKKEEKIDTLDHLENKSRIHSAMYASDRSWLLSNSRNNSKAKDTSSSFFLNNQHFLIILRLLRRLKRLSYLLFFIVLGSQAMLAIYINQKFQIESNDYIINIAEASAELANAALLSRGIYLNINNTMPDINALESLANTTLNIFNLSNELKVLAKASQCTKDSIFVDQINQEFNVMHPSFTYKPMINIFEDISLANKIYLNTSNENPLNFIIFNGMISSNILYTTYNSLTACEINEISAKEQTLAILTITSYIICAISIFLLMWSIKIMKKHYRIIWKTFCKFTDKYKLDIRQNVIDRLIDVHGKIEWTEYLEEVHEKKDSQTDIKHENFQYLWRISLYVMLVSSYNAFIYAYAKTEIHSIMQFQLGSLQNNYNHKILGLYLNFWIREKTLENKQISLDNIYPEMILFEEYEIELINIQNSLLNSQKYFFSNNFKKYLSSSSYNLLFVNNNSDTIIGLYELGNQLLITSYEITVNSSIDILLEFKKTLDIYQSVVSNFTEMTIIDLNSVFSDKKSIILIVSSVYLIFSYILYIMIFNCLLLDHYNKIKNIQRLEELIPLPAMI